MTRRRFPVPSAALAAALAICIREAPAKAPDRPLPKMLENAGERLVDWKPITQAPGFHWFSYYDVLQFDPTGRYVLGMKVAFEGRQMTADESIEIGMIDLKNNNLWRKLGTSKAWCWQQGCRLQWRPGADREVLWNDREAGKFVCRILDVQSGRMRTLPAPVYHVSPDGKTALVADFARSGWARPDYGYQGIEDPFRNEDAPQGSGISKMDLATGALHPLFSLADIAAIPSMGYQPGVTQGRHYFNHLCWSPDGSKFLFLHLGAGFKFDRMFVADADGRNPRFITSSPSHYTWRDNDTILCFTSSAYRWFHADGKSNEPTAAQVLFKATNGHQTFIPGTDWLLTDTYPEGGKDAETTQYVYLYHLKTGKIIIIGKFHAPPAYQGIWRCDTHPRLSPDGTKVTIDSPHANGRQIYLADISALTAPPREHPPQ